MVVDAGDTEVLLHLFLMDVALLRHEEEKLLKTRGLESPSTVILSENTRTPTLYFLPTSPNVEGVKTNHHNISPP